MVRCALCDLCVRNVLDRISRKLPHAKGAKAAKVRSPIRVHSCSSVVKICCLETRSVRKRTAHVIHAARLLMIAPSSTVRCALCDLCVRNALDRIPRKLPHATGAKAAKVRSPIRVHSYSSVVKICCLGIRSVRKRTAHGRTLFTDSKTIF